ncbi:branched-chain amino acid ABC transporter, permease component (LivH-like) protein [Paramagnetospirillum caucaseum]|uniref:Branched-chain amino acid ABC transporter, permease component (LivH-like) protein n=1 Tax=Paramagnetospirillum caucaseum TaxID=1244869 RepID=M3A9T8_9PROT|nr:branched-chain amino acid ABC transporter permease [Paramagnetospirillum caucaseum]EME69269.1 branched-chain amino acid ABC transporter, permease component (LivH-like) protein [Paramagnetospirillum caucaseum]
MSPEFIQFILSGITLGATYTLAALGFSMIFNASGVINFAQGEFIMIGGMCASVLVSAGIPLPLACIVGVMAAGLIGYLMERLAVGQCRDAEVATLILVTIGVSMIVRGLTEIFFGKANHGLPHFSSDKPIEIAGATILPQSLWVLAVSALIVVGLKLFFSRTQLGKGMLAASYDRLAAQLVGIDVRRVLTLSFILSALIGAFGGILVTPISTVAYDTGIMLGLKGFVAATLGGLGSGSGAVFGGLLLGLVEALTAGYVSSAYKDAVPFVMVFIVMVLRPQGLLGAKPTDRI